MKYSSRVHESISIKVDVDTFGRREAREFQYEELNRENFSNGYMKCAHSLEDGVNNFQYIVISEADFI